MVYSCSEPFPYSSVQRRILEALYPSWCHVVPLKKTDGRWDGKMFRGRDGWLTKIWPCSPSLQVKVGQNIIDSTSVIKAHWPQVDHKFLMITVDAAYNANSLISSSCTIAWSCLKYSYLAHLMQSEKKVTNINWWYTIRISWCYAILITGRKNR